MHTGGIDAEQSKKEALSMGVRPATRHQISNNKNDSNGRNPLNRVAVRVHHGSIRAAAIATTRVVVSTPIRVSMHRLKANIGSSIMQWCVRRILVYGKDTALRLLVHLPASSATTSPYAQPNTERDEHETSSKDIRPPTKNSLLIMGLLL